MTCTAPPQVADDTDGGQIVNIVIATATGLGLSGPATDTDLAWVTVERRDIPAISLVKLVNGIHAPTAPGPAVAAGAPVTFTFTVTNRGLVPLSDIRLVDDTIPGVSCSAATLRPRESMTCTAPRQSAVRGNHVNVATVTGSASGGRRATATDSGHYTNSAISPNPPPDTDTEGSGTAQTQLPVTGRGSVNLVAVGAALVGVGLLLARLGRRRPAAVDGR
jgi:uncharacterized repeat protein (TIGR01451 family)/LPXTG-motif cell wall-anchored protein